MRRRVVAIAAATLLVTAAGQAPAQTRAGRGAVVGGILGAGAGAALGALVGRGVCDAADCSGAWIDGAAPGVVLGGFAGAAVGAAVGALLRGREAPRSRQGRGLELVALVDASAAEAESESVEQTVRGLRALIGANLGGGLVIGPSIERLTGGEWRVSSVALAARLDPGRGAVRPFLEADLGRMSWRHPSILAECTPAPPSCTYRPGTLSDRYGGLSGAVGASAGDRAGAWRLHVQVRFHHAGGRPTGEPGSTSSRQLRQLALGGSVAIRLR